jgi:hypothetical protein
MCYTKAHNLQSANKPAANQEAPLDPYWPNNLLPAYAASAAPAAISAPDTSRSDHDAPN